MILSWIERPIAFLALLVCSPIVAIAALAIFIEDGWPVFFSQPRVGRHHRLFRLWKLRSMRMRTRQGAQITSSGDSRITRVGRVLRKYKVDELPQLWNVCRGEMSLIGPRPEVAAYVTAGDPLWAQVLSVRPGITDLSTLVFRNEEQLLAQAADPDRYYRTVLLPEKLKLAWRYQARRNAGKDLKLLYTTVLCSIAPSTFNPEYLKRTFLGADI